jgi:hypothetical protein
MLQEVFHKIIFLFLTKIHLLAKNSNIPFIYRFHVPSPKPEFKYTISSIIRQYDMGPDNYGTKLFHNFKLDILLGHHGLKICGSL